MFCCRGETCVKSGVRVLCGVACRCWWHCSLGYCWNGLAFVVKVINANTHTHENFCRKRSACDKTSWLFKCMPRRTPYSTSTTNVHKVHSPLQVKVPTCCYYFRDYSIIQGVTNECTSNRWNMWQFRWWIQHCRVHFKSISVLINLPRWVDGWKATPSYLNGSNSQVVLQTCTE